MSPISMTLLVCLASLAMATDKVTFDEHVFPIFERSCLNCHNPEKTRGGLDLSSYRGTLKGSSGGKIVEAGELSSSLITVVRHQGEPVMPPEGDAIPNEEITVLEAWIQGGLLENNS
ncbi:MAG: c-type cytochrome domain-containing protein, partial [Verrucomicrobiales bacterium]